MSETEADFSLDAINSELSDLLKQREGVDDSVLIATLRETCHELPPNLRVIFDLKISKDSNSALDEELRNRLQTAGILVEQDEECRLVVQSPIQRFVDTVGNTSGSREARLKGDNRDPFREETFPDIDRDSYKRLGQRSVLSVEPSGYLMRFSLKQYNLTSSSIQRVSVSEDRSIPLSPALTNDGEVIPVADWGQKT